MRRQRDREAEVPIASQMPAGHQIPIPAMNPAHHHAMAGMSPGRIAHEVPPSGDAPHRLGGEDLLAEQRRRKQEEMKRALAEQIAEKERQKKEEEEQRRASKICEAAMFERWTYEDIKKMEWSPQRTSRADGPTRMVDRPVSWAVYTMFCQNLM